MLRSAWVGQVTERRKPHPPNRQQLVAYLGLQFALVVEGVVVVESLFAWPGIGHPLVHAVLARDVAMVQGTVLVLALGFVFLNALTDLATVMLDPRRRASA